MRANGILSNDFKEALGRVDKRAPTGCSYLAVNHPQARRTVALPGSVGLPGTVSSSRPQGDTVS